MQYKAYHEQVILRRLEEAQAESTALLRDQQEEAKKRKAYELEQRQKEEDRRRRAARQEQQRAAFEEQQKKKVENNRRYRDWRQAYDTVLKRRAGDLKAPPKPYPACTEHSCKARWSINTCPHDLAVLFSSTDNPQQTRKEERNRWHPDRFCKLPDQPTVWKLATEVYQQIGQVPETLKAEAGSGLERDT